MNANLIDKKLSVDTVQELILHELFAPAGDRKVVPAREHPEPTPVDDGHFGKEVVGTICEDVLHALGYYQTKTLESESAPFEVLTYAKVLPNGHIHYLQLRWNRETGQFSPARDVLSPEQPIYSRRIIERPSDDAASAGSDDNSSPKRLPPAE